MNWERRWGGVGRRWEGLLERCSQTPRVCVWPDTVPFAEHSKGCGGVCDLLERKGQRMFQAQVWM